MDWRFHSALMYNILVIDREGLPCVLRGEIAIIVPPVLNCRSSSNFPRSNTPLEPAFAGNDVFYVSHWYCSKPGHPSSAPCRGRMHHISDIVLMPDGASGVTKGDAARSRLRGHARIAVDGPSGGVVGTLGMRLARTKCHGRSERQTTSLYRRRMEAGLKGKARG